MGYVDFDIGNGPVKYEDMYDLGTYSTCVSYLHGPFEIEVKFGMSNLPHHSDNEESDSILDADSIVGSENDEESDFSDFESPEESVPPKPLEKSFKEESCVICLEKEPNVLLIDCNHICTCEDCENTKPSTRCPCCRTEISKRILI